jgi:predicted Zn-dependent protease
MIKATIQLAILVTLFFATWFVLGKVNWMGILHVKENANATEKKLGDLIWKAYSEAEEEVHDTTVTGPIWQVVRRICRNNGIDSNKIKLHVLNKDEINAFTLPNDHIVVYTGLVTACDSDTELAGVLGHEMAHMEKNHVMKKLVKEVGLSVLLTVTAGKGGEIAKKLAKMASSGAYDRDLEKEADIASVDYMLKANINPGPFANFLYRLADGETKLPKEIAWTNTHPDSKDRAKYIIEYAKGKTFTSQPILAVNQWEQLKEGCKAEVE